jgi:tetratricopeptide (TPR) repeat protein
LKWSRSRAICATAALALAASAAGAALRSGTFAMVTAAGRSLAAWLDDTVAGSPVEAALYRPMPLPGGDFLFRKPPREALAALERLTATSGSDAALWQLRALEDEKALDFTAAERDWKTWVAKSSDKPAAELDLANFYARQLRPQDELAALKIVGESPAAPGERWTEPQHQRAWQAWSRSLTVAQQFALPPAVSEAIYREWEQRYPDSIAVVRQEFDYLLRSGDFPAATALIARYQAAFPRDAVTPVQWQAELAAKRGSPQDGLAIYNRSFQPLWPEQLVSAWYQLLVQGREVRQTSDQLRAKLASNPGDLDDTAKLFYLEQQQNRMDSARAVLEHFRQQHDASGQPWTDTELYTLAQLSARVTDIPAEARYDYALAAYGPDPAQGAPWPKARLEGLTGLARLLLSDPGQPLRVGAANLSLYRDIATMDQGPGYLNGILSLLLNTTSPSSQLAQEDQLAIPYYHRAKAADILALIDQHYPDAPQRPALHAMLIQAYQAYGENAAVIRGGNSFLADFPHAPQRVDVALETADAYSRTGQTTQEFALYQSLLKELGALAGGMPLGDSSSQWNEETQYGHSTARSQPYARVLNLYLSRLVALGRLPDALEVLRGELAHNPRDPGLYDRLAQFLEQNSLDAHVEEVYEGAIAQFQSESWYAKLARFYLRQRRDEDYAALSRKVTGIFSGTELAAYLRQAPAPDRSLAIEVNLYASQRFPHDLQFVQNLIAEYGEMHDQQKVDQLLWAHWSESPDLRRELFEQLSSTGQLDQVLSQLRQQTPQIGAGQWMQLASSNPAAERFWLEVCLWQSHFEQAVDAAGALSAAYPANAEIGDQAASLYRSFAYFHPEDTDRAVAIENRLLSADPGDLDTMARIGDIYADRGHMSDADPYWRRMAEAHPGDSSGYLQSATVFWDYFDFQNARQELETARQKLKEPTLFGYQMGAIDESEGDVAAAIPEYVASAVAKNPSYESQGRLLTLAGRAATQPLVESETASLLSGDSPSPAAISLRVSILDAEHRHDELSQELKALVARSGSFDVLEAVASSAQSDSLPQVQQAALERQIALTTDPVRSLQLRYQLVDFYTSQSQPTAAAAEIDAIDRQYPNILGVVRATVDYDWDHNRRPQAVAVLQAAAQAAYPELRRQFQLEAAGKLTDLGEYAQSASLLQSLLTAEPLNAEMEAAMAHNYAASGNQKALIAFYQQELIAVKASSLDPADKQQRIGQMRRGMIAAATVLGSYSEAVDQYIELIDAYPEDAGLTQEAALYAIVHNQRERLLGYYQKAIQESTRNPNWSIVLARLATTAEDFPTAVDAYSKAIALRPERQDLLIAQADLETRLQRLDDAAVDYQKLYALSYHDPQWMQKVAEVRARQGRTADAVQALQTAWIDGRPPKPASDFQLAAQLLSWNMLEPARQFAEKGVQLAGADLLVSPEDQSGAATWARILARLRQSGAAYTQLAAARQQAGQASIASAAEHEVAGISAKDWQKARAEERASAATSAFTQAMRAMGGVVRDYYTPEERAQFAAWLEAKAAGAGVKDLNRVWIPTAQSAHLAQAEADLRWQAVVADPHHSDLQSWVRLEEQRVQLRDVGEKIESLPPANGRPLDQVALWQTAADVDQRSGDTAAELRVLTKLTNAESLNGNEQARFYRLLLALQPQQLAQLAAHNDAAAQYLVVHGSANQALAAIDARSRNLPPVWLTAYTALTGLYRNQRTPQVEQAFIGALDANATIGNRLAHPVDRNEELADSVWFYYGSRYGEYLDEQNNPEASGYLESGLEAAPGNPQAYVELADYSAKAGKPQEALTDYRLSLQLDPNQPSVLNRIAVLEWKSGQQADAIAEWKSAAALVVKQMNAKPVPQTFWGDTAQVLRDASAAGQYEAIRQPIDPMIRAYLERNGSYMADPLLKAGYRANGNSISWVLGMVAGLNSERDLLSTLLYSSSWIAKDQQSAILARLVALDRIAAQNDPATQTDQMLTDESAWAAALLDEGKPEQARTVIAQVPADRRWSANWLGPEIRLAQMDGALWQMVAQWKAAGSHAPDPDTVRNVAATLSKPAKDVVMAWVYEQALAARNFSAPNFLGLAAIRLDSGDVPDAMQLLQRMVLVGNDQYADMDSAASLLEERHHPAQALQFLRPLAQVSPWNAGYKVRLAQAMLAVTPQSPQALAMLQSVAADSNAEYAQRVAAAEALKGYAQPGAFSGAAELALLAQPGCPTAQQASQPMYLEARLVAAACASNDAARAPLLREALALAPNSQHIRLLYVWAAFASGQDADALLAAEPLLQASPYASYTNYGYDYGYNGQQSNSASLMPEQAGRLYLLVAHALEKQNENSTALQEAQQGLPLAVKSPRYAALQAEEERLATLVARQSQNEARAPAIHPALDQDHVVRPLLFGEVTP